MKIVEGAYPSESFLLQDRKIEEGKMHKMEIIQSLIEQCKQIFHVKAIYGEPIEKEGVTVVPVSHISIKGGFGIGKKQQNEKQGKGGGMNSQVRPVGFLKIGEGKTKFIPVFDMVTFFYQIICILGMTLTFVLLIIKMAKKREQTLLMQQLIKMNKKI